MAAELRREFGVRARRTLSREVRFDVRLDGKTVFSAAECGHLPRQGEVTERIRELDREERGQPAD